MVDEEITRENQVERPPKQYEDAVPSVVEETLPLGIDDKTLEKGLLDLGHGEVESLTGGVSCVEKHTMGPTKSERSGEDVFGEHDVSVSDTEDLLDDLEKVLGAVDVGSESGSSDGLSNFELKELGRVDESSESVNTYPIRDFDLDLRVELGRASIHRNEVAKLRRGSVVKLGELVGDPVNVYADGRLVAHGEVLVLDGKFCVRVTELNL